MLFNEHLAVIGSKDDGRVFKKPHGRKLIEEFTQALVESLYGLLVAALKQGPVVNIDVVDVEKKTIAGTLGQREQHVAIDVTRGSNRRGLEDVQGLTWRRQADFNPRIKTLVVTTGLVKQFVRNDPERPVTSPTHVFREGFQAVRNAGILLSGFGEPRHAAGHKGVPFQRTLSLPGLDARSAPGKDGGHRHGRGVVGRHCIGEELATGGKSIDVRGQCGSDCRGGRGGRGGRGVGGYVILSQRVHYDEDDPIWHLCGFRLRTLDRAGECDRKDSKPGQLAKFLHEPDLIASIQRSTRNLPKTLSTW